MLDLRTLKTQRRVRNKVLLLGFIGNLVQRVSISNESSSINNYLDMESLFSFIFNINNEILDGFTKGINASLLVAMSIECERDLKTSFSLFDMAIDLIARSRGAYSWRDDGILRNGAIFICTIVLP